MEASKLPKTLRKYADFIADYSDERGSDNGIWVYYVLGYKSYTDAIGCLHQEHEDTVSEVADHGRNRLKCDCDECKGARA